MDTRSIRGTGSTYYRRTHEAELLFQASANEASKGLVPVLATVR
jgi:hypothetical protein